MRREKRYMSAIVAMAMAAASLAGCGQGNKAAEPASSASSGTMAASVSGTQGQSEQPLTYWTELNFNVSTNFSNLGETPFAKAWREQTGVAVEFLHPPVNQKPQEQFGLLMADGNLPDLMEYDWLNNYPGGPAKAIADGNIIPLNDVIDQYCPNLKKYLAENPEIDRMVKTDEGTYYGFPFIRGDDKLCTPMGLMVRSDWLEDLGLEIPTTVDEWHTALAQFKEQKGAIAPLTWNYTADAKNDENPFAYAYGTRRQWYVGQDGKAHFGAMETGWKEFLATMNQWYQEGLIDQDLATLNVDQESAKMASGMAGASWGWAGSGMGTYMNAAVATNPGYMLAAAPYPTLMKGAKPEMGQIDNKALGAGFVAITTSCQDVERAAKMMDYGYGEEGHLLFNFGVEGESYEMVDGYPTYTDKVLKSQDGWSVGQSIAAYARGNYLGPFVQDARYLEQYYTLDCQKGSNELWGQTNAAAYKMPPTTPTAEESKEFATIMNDVNTYRDEMTLKFIFGTESLDNFDAYVKTLESMGIHRAIEIQNAALERYQKR